MPNILFTCAGRRTYLLKYFKEQLGDAGKIIGADMQLSAPALSVVDVKEKVPAVYADNYIDCIIDICKRNNVDAIISLNDLELPILAANEDRFKNIGVVPIVSRVEVIDICFDKYATAQFIERIGLKTPKTFINFDDAQNALLRGDLKFPLVLKPRWGSGSIGIEFVNDLDELKEVYDILLKKVKKSILATASKGEEYILIQQKVVGEEYGADIMNDLKGNNRGVSIKRKLAMRAGETDKAEIVDNAQIRTIGKILGEELKHIGNLDVDIIKEDGEYYVLELNPRFGGGFPFSYEAGVNFPKAIVEWLKGNDIDNSILIPKYGMAFAKCDYLVAIKP